MPPPDCATIGYNPDRHLGLVTSTWLHSYRSSDTARMVHPATYTQMQRGVIEHLLGERGLRPDIVAAANGEVIAWSLWEQTLPGDGKPMRDILHYVWVAQPIRRCGFAWRMLREHSASRTTVLSHWSDHAGRAYGASTTLRQLFCAANSHHPRFCPTLTANPNAFVAM